MTWIKCGVCPQEVPCPLGRTTVNDKLSVSCSVTNMNQRCERTQGSVTDPNPLQMGVTKTNRRMIQIHLPWLVVLRAGSQSAFVAEVTEENWATAINLLPITTSVAAGDWLVIYGGVAINSGPISWSGCISSRNI